MYVRTVAVPEFGRPAHNFTVGPLAGLADAGCGSCCSSCAGGGSCEGDNAHPHAIPALLTPHEGIPTWGWLALGGALIAALSFAHDRKQLI